LSLIGDHLLMHFHAGSKFAQLSPNKTWGHSSWASKAGTRYASNVDIPIPDRRNVNKTNWKFRLLLAPPNSPLQGCSAPRRD
jgi:hypothetical protein